MTKKSLGFTELEWICPNCKNRNPGTRKSCASCGVAKPDDIDFIQPAHEAFIEDDEKIAAAKAGPDIHCGYCGTRNPAGATICKQCGGDLSEGQARIKGNVLGAHRHEPAPLKHFLPLLWFGKPGQRYHLCQLWQCLATCSV